MTLSTGDQTDYPINIIVHYANETNEWMTAASMPYGLADVTAASYNDQMYIFGGYGSSASDVENYTLKFDPSSDSWTQMAEMPIARWGAAAAAYNGIIYVFGGTPNGNWLSGTEAVEGYNVSANSWLNMTNLPTNIAAQGLMAVTVGSNIYLFFAQYTYMFNATANNGLGSYTQEADAPLSRSWATCAYVNVGGQERIYLIGGYDWANGDASNANYYYDVGDNTWSSPQATAPYAAYGTLRDNPVYNGTIYYGFGFDNTVFYNYTYSYNPSSNSWSSLLSEASYARDGVGCAWINGNLYVVGGRDTASGPFGLNYNEVFSQVIGEDNGSNVYVNSECRPDFGDIRFSWWNSSSDSDQPCNYWLESYTSSQVANFWVQVPEIVSGTNSTIYIYYGNPNVSTTSNGANVFPFFDDFNRQNSSIVGNGWTENEDPNGILSIENNLLEINQYENYYCHVERPALNFSNFTLNGEIMIGNYSGASWAPMIYAYWGSYNWVGIGPNTYPSNSIRSHMDVASTFSETTTESGAITYGTWVYLRIDVTPSYVDTEWSTDSITWNTLISISRPSSWSGAPSLIIVGKGFAEDSSSYPNSYLDNDYSSAGNLGTSYADDIFVSNYASPQPIQGGWGNQEAAPTSPTVSVSPSSWTMDVGQGKTFSATPSGGSGSYSGYQWYVNGVAQAGQTGATYMFAPGASGTYSITVTVTDSSGLTSPQSSPATVTVNASPTVSVAPVGPLAMDVGQVQTFTAAVTGGSGTISYQWYLDGAAVGSNSASYSYTAAGTSHSVTCKVTDSASTPVTSPASNAVAITVAASPTVSISPGSATLDVGQSAMFAATTSGGSGSLSFQWYVNSVLQSAATSSFTYAASATGTFTVYVQVTDKASTPVTVKSNSAVVNVNSALVAPTASASPATVDQGQTSSLTSTAVTTGTSPYTYQWLEEAPGASSYSAISGATSSSYSFVTSGSTATGTWSFELQVTDAAGATVTSNAVTVNAAAPTALTVSVLPASWTMDMGQSITFSASASGGSGTYSSYQWYVNGVAQAGQTASTFSFAPVSAGSYSITVTVTDSSGATSPQSSAATVTVAASPTVSITPVGPLAMDVGQVQTFTATVTGGSGTISYQWYLDGTAVGSNSASYSYTASGTSHTVTCKVTDSASNPVTSPASNAVIITVAASPTVSISPGSATLDVGQSTTFTATTSGGSGSLSFQWYVNSVLQSASTSSFTYAASAAGTFTIYVQVTDKASTPVTVKSNSAVVNVNSALVAPTASASPATVDQGQTSSLTSTAVTTGTSPYTYQWLEEAPGATSYSDVGTNSASFSFATTASTTTGTWSFELKVTDSTGAVVTSGAVTVKVDSALSAPTVTATPTTLTRGQTSSLTSTTVTTGSGGYSYQWLEEAPGAHSYSAISGATSSSYSFVTSSSTTTGTWHFELKVTDSTGASVTSNVVTVTVRR